eukprot:1157937-Pelagomonas_calceolata.AAC.3
MVALTVPKDTLPPLLKQVTSASVIRDTSMPCPACMREARQQALHAGAENAALYHTVQGQQEENADRAWQHARIGRPVRRIGTSVPTTVNRPPSGCWFTVHDSRHKCPHINSYSPSIPEGLDRVWCAEGRCPGAIAQSPGDEGSFFCCFDIMTG